MESGRRVGRLTKGPANYRSHDYRFLMRRWRILCKKAGLRIKKVTEADGFPCYEISSRVLSDEDGVYLSAGIHGDEPGSTEGLLNWAEKNHSRLCKLPLLIYPCLNPWGLVNNSRGDARGTDLNRIWERPQHPYLRKVFEGVRGKNFKLAMTLHEDFDGQGIYLYEPFAGGRSDGWAETILKAGQSFFPLDPRKKIEGRNARNGIIRPRPNNPPEEGIPEALYLYHHHAPRTFTVETPSESDLSIRVVAHRMMLEAAIGLVG